MPDDGQPGERTPSASTRSLMVNQDGKRFANEDVRAQGLQNAIKRQKGGVSYQIFDSKWKEQPSAMPQCFGGVTHYPRRAGSRVRGTPSTHFAAGCAYRRTSRGRDRAGLHHPSRFHRGVGEGREHPGWRAGGDGGALQRRRRTRARDADFSKVSARLFPIENPPYYAVPFGDSGNVGC